MINGTDRILVCCGTGCIANGALKVADAIEQELAARGLTGDVISSWSDFERLSSAKSRIVRSGTQIICV